MEWIRVESRVRDWLGVDLMTGIDRGLDGVDLKAGGWVGFLSRWEWICDVVDVVLDVWRASASR